MTKKRLLALILFLFSIFALGCERQRPQIIPSPTPLATVVIPTSTPTTPPTSTPTPTPVASPTPSPTPAGEVEYVIQPGDNLFRLSLRFGTTVEAILARNPGLDPLRLRIGQVIIIPVRATGTIYIVQAGDNLFRIALRFGTTVEAIMEANDLTSTTIYVGQRLIIPAADP